MKHRAKNAVKYSSVEWSTHFTGRNDQDSHGNADTRSGRFPGAKRDT